jgi:DMSO reductase anchor subunit
VIESIPSGRRQAEVTLPGFPDPAISRPNIRFEQSRSLPAQLTRADGSPLRYEREAPGGNGLENGITPRRFEVKPLDPGGPKGWGIGQLRSREDSLVLFTLLSQWVVGAFLLLFLIPKWGGSAGEILTAHPLVLRWTLIGLFGLQTFGMVSSTMHLGKPRFFYRALNNLRHSWVSREIAAMGTFYNLLGAAALITTFPILTAWLPETFSTLLPELIGGGGAAMGLLGLYCMARCYRIPARPFWDHWHTGAAFSASGMILGSLSLGLIFGAAEFSEGRAVTPLFRLLAVPFLVGLALQAAALIAHARDLKRRGEEGAVSWRLMTTRFGKTHLARFASLGLLAALGLLFAGGIPEGGSALAIWGGMSIVALLHELIGRAIFYVLVVPTTHPGAFFWGNKSFEAHARKSGLAALPQVGVAPDGH